MDKIFIQIASYRDPELLPTIKDILDKAKYPERLTFAIAWQHSKEDSWDDLSEFIEDKRFKIIDIDSNDGKGVCWARSKTQKLWSGEKYTLQLDSHHRFIENWDEEVIQMFLNIKEDKPIITAYLDVYEPDTNKTIDSGPWKMVPSFYNSNGILLFLPKFLSEEENWDRPRRSAFLSGHFLFTYGFWNKEIPYDPNIYFSGEEISLSLRSFSKGYRMFQPNKILAYHEYTRNFRIKHWDERIHQEFIGELEISGSKRIRQLFGEDNKIDLGIYDLGDRSTVQEYEKFAGINFLKKEIFEDAKKEKESPIILDKIFIQIVSYRDADLVSTIKDLLSKAEFPQRLTFGILRQYAEEDNGFDDLTEFKNNPQFRIIETPSYNSKGVGWARSQVQKLWRQEEYTLQLDSHHRFIERWDSELIRLSLKTKSPKPIISSYGTPFIPDYVKEGGYFSPDPYIFKPRGFCNNGGLVMNYGPPTEEQKEYELLRNYSVGGHYIFTIGKWNQEVPYDPEMYFYGEEITMAIRSFSLGYELFSATKNILWHYFGRTESNRHWDDFDGQEVNRLYHPALLKLRNFLGTTKEHEEKFEVIEYGLKGKRTLEDYEMYAGVDFKNQRIYEHDLIQPPVFTSKEEFLKWKNNPPKKEKRKVTINWTKLKKDIVLEEVENKDSIPVSITKKDQYVIDTKHTTFDYEGDLNFEYYSTEEAALILTIPHRSVKGHRWIFWDINKYKKEEE